MATATFRHGNPTMVDHTPSSDVSAGDVVVINDSIRIAHRDIEANELGALADGGGVYDIAKDSATTGDDGDLIYWDAADGEVNTDSANPLIGKLVGAAVDGQTTCRVHHLNVKLTDAVGGG